MKTGYKALFLLFLLCVQGTKVFAEESATTKSETETKPQGDFTAEEEEEIEKHGERHEFQAEVGRLMDIIINSLYTQKEIFLRELISNASDACDKIRFQSVQDSSVLGEKSELEIRVEYDSEAKTVSIQDAGVGMTKQELISNLGTVAKSGTTQFIEAIKGGSLNLIGQFGVGFYSTFLAASKVTVVSKSNKDDTQHIWESSAAHSFVISEDPRGDTLKRGTKVIIHLKQDAYEFANEERLRNLIKKYSEFINFPIYLRVQKEVSKEVPVEDEEDKKEDEEGEDKKDDLEVKDEEDKKQKTKTVKEKSWDWELVNDNKALWLRSKDEIEDEEYNKFYKALTKETDEPLAHIHFSAEGEVEFKSILFIPGKSQNDQFENYYGRSSALKLYVRRVLINEEFEDLMPRYLNFIRGVVDSDELPLNVSRESLQQLKMMKVISRKLVRKAIEMIKKLSEEKDEEDEDDDDDDDDDEEGSDKKDDKDKEDKELVDNYLKFWKEFGKSIKLGIIEDPANRSKLAKLTRWYTSKNITELSSFDDYLTRAKPGQEQIYYLAGESKDQILKNPVTQKLLKKGYELLLLDDPIDEFCFQHLTEYEKKRFVNVGKGDFKLPEDDDMGRRKIRKLRKMFEPLTNWWRDLMSEAIETVQISQRLVEDPCVVVSSEHGYSANLERISKAQAYANQDRSSQMTNQKKILEVNPAHPIIKELLDRIKDNSSGDKETEDMAKMLAETALINSGYSVASPSEFSKRFYKLFYGAMGIPKDSPIEDIEITLDEDEDEDGKKKKDEFDEDDKDDEDEEDKKSKDEL